MKKILFLSVLIAFIFSQEILGCDCPPPKPFLTVASNSNLIVLAKVRRYLTYDDDSDGNAWVTSMEVKIDEILQGKEERKTIKIRRTVCSKSLSEFEINKTYIFGISGENDEYYLPKCGGSWLLVENGIAKGNIAEGIENISLDELKSKIQKTQISSSILSFNFAENFFIQNKCEL